MMEMTSSGKHVGSPQTKAKQSTQMHYTPHNIASVAADAAASVHATHANAQSAQMNDAKAKTVLKEAVDAVVNSFAKHTHGQGRGNAIYHLLYVKI